MDGEEREISKRWIEERKVKCVTWTEDCTGRKKKGDKKKCKSEVGGKILPLKN